jgi:phosphatidate cytidylyltransferase
MNLLWRFLSVFVLLPPLLIAGYLGGWYTWAFLVLFGGVACWEWMRMFRCNQADQIIAVVGFVVLMTTADPGLNLSTGLLLLFLLISLYILVTDGQKRVDRISLILMASLYLGFLLRYIALLRALPDGWYLLLLCLAGTFGADSFAFFVGKLFGRRHLFPRISPGKTLEGTMASLLGGVLGVLLMAIVFGRSLAVIVPLGILISLGALVGDLFESIFKREAGVKDSSNLIPGHGGFLDRLDSVLFTAPLVYYYAVLFLELGG